MDSDISLFETEWAITKSQPVDDAQNKSSHPHLAQLSKGRSHGVLAAGLCPGGLARGRIRPITKPCIQKVKKT